MTESAQVGRFSEKDYSESPCNRGITYKDMAKKKNINRDWYADFVMSVYL